MSDQNYFKTSILSSVDLPAKEFYSIEEGMKIMACSRRTIRRYGRNFKKAEGSIRLKIEPDGTILYESFADFFKD